MADSSRLYRIDALIAEGFTRRQIHYYQETGLLPRAFGRGAHAYYSDHHLRILRGIREARDTKISLADLADRFHRTYQNTGRDRQCLTPA